MHDLTEAGKQQRHHRDHDLLFRFGLCPRYKNCAREGETFKV